MKQYKYSSFQIWQYKNLEKTAKTFSTIVAVVMQSFIYVELDREWKHSTIKHLQIYLQSETMKHTEIKKFKHTWETEVLNRAAKCLYDSGREQLCWISPSPTRGPLKEILISKCTCGRFRTPIGDKLLYWYDSIYNKKAGKLYFFTSKLRANYNTQGQFHCHKILIK